MCDKAKEIQNWTFIDLDCSDYVVCRSTYDVMYANNVAGGLSPEEWIWLPRQEQLQEMLSRKEITVVHNLENGPRGQVDLLIGDVRKAILFRFAEFIDNENKYTEYMNTYEQLWLSFLMKEKFNKKWNGKKWKEVK